MKGREKNFYKLYGKYHAKHKALISDKRHKDERAYDSLIDSIFERQRAVYEPAKPTDDRETRIARTFYDNFFVEPSLRFGSPIGAIADTQEFLEEVAIKPGEPERNQMVYLLGEIGSGKTAYINWLTSTRFKKLVDQKNFWFIRTDLEDLKQGNPVSPEELIYYIGYEIDDVLSKYENIYVGCDDARGQLKLALAGDEGNHIEKKFLERAQALKRLVNEIQIKNGRRLLLIIDNIDFICHYNDRGLYYDDENTGEMHVLQTVCKFIELFGRQRELGHLGANVLIVTRLDSYEVLCEAMTTSYEAPPITSGSKVYILEAREWRKVVDARCGLMRAKIDELDQPGKRSHYEQIPLAVEEDINYGEPRLIEHLLGITNNGFRQMMGFFGQYGWVDGNERIPGQPRLIHSYPVGLLTFILKRKARFSQFLSKFPNIYLVNRIPVEGQTYSSMHEHRHSYWLKRMMLELVVSGNFSGVSDILDIFREREDRYGYEESIIRECLGSLTDATCSDCIRVMRGLHPNRTHQALIVQSLSPTKRGKHCLQYIFDKFLYLQLIVEDPYLPFPNVVEEEFRYERLDEKDLDYTYVVDTQDVYKKKSTEIVQVKAKQVLIFLEVLGVSLQIEKGVYSDVFKQLSNRGIMPPDVDNIKKSVIEELNAINRRLHQIIDLPTIAQKAQAYRSDLYDQLKKAYRCELPTITKEQ